MEAVCYSQNLFEWDTLKPLIIAPDYQSSFLANVRRFHLLVNGKRVKEAGDDRLAQSLKDLHAHGGRLLHLNLDFNGPVSISTVLCTWDALISV